MRIQVRPGLGNGDPFFLPEGWAVPRFGEAVVHPDTLDSLWVTHVIHEPAENRVSVHTSTRRPT